MSACCSPPTHPDVYVIDRYVSASEKNSMIASADCYVSLHRSEGFGLTPAEALGMGKPVIATRYGGNLDFMNDRNSWLVDYRLMPIGPRAASRTRQRREWADPDVDQAARYMREIFERPGRGARACAPRRPRHARAYTRRRPPGAPCSDAWSTSTHAAIAGRDAPSKKLRRSPISAQLEQLVQGGPRPRSRSPFGLPAAAAAPRRAESDQAFHRLPADGQLRAAQGCARDRAERGQSAPGSAGRAYAHGPTNRRTAWRVAPTGRPHRGVIGAAAWHALCQFR